MCRGISWQLVGFGYWGAFHLRETHDERGLFRSKHQHGPAARVWAARPHIEKMLLCEFSHRPW